MQSERHCQTFPLRIPASTRAAAGELAKRHGVSLNYFILVAIMERVEKMDREGRVSAREPEEKAPAEQVIAVDEHN